ncbi:MAG: hypothetical protein NXI04_15680 [Planctomycetaceae bacterium]|nr:hypothetical protein [Planctomycetaceae bacterium]
MSIPAKVKPPAIVRMLFATERVSAVPQYVVVLPDVTSGADADVDSTVRISNQTLVDWRAAPVIGYGFPKDESSVRSLQGALAMPPGTTADFTFREPVAVTQTIEVDLDDIKLAAKPVAAIRKAQLTAWPDRFERFFDVTWQATDDPGMAKKQSVSGKKERAAFLKTPAQVGTVGEIQVTRKDLNATRASLTQDALAYREHHEWQVKLVKPKKTPMDVTIKTDLPWQRATAAGDVQASPASMISMVKDEVLYAVRQEIHSLRLSGIVSIHQSPAGKTVDPSGATLKVSADFLSTLVSARKRIGNSPKERDELEPILKWLDDELKIVVAAHVNYLKAFEHEKPFQILMLKKLEQTSLTAAQRTARESKLHESKRVVEEKRRIFEQAAHDYNDKVRVLHP